MNRKMIEDTIRNHSFEAVFPDGSPYACIAIDQVKAIEKSSKLSARKIETVALENDIIPERYARNFDAFSYRDQIKLLSSTVAIIGLGGLGGGVIEILARIGIGKLILIDGDTFEETNLNRQSLSTMNNLGFSKALAAKQRIKEINSSVSVISYNEFINRHNASSMLSDTNVIVDCLDSISTRFLVQNIAHNLKKPLVSAAVAGCAGQLTTIFPEDKGLTLIYGDQGKHYSAGAEKHLGCLPQTVTILSSLECSEVLKILLNKGSLLRNQLLIIDLDSNDFKIMKLA